MKGIDIEDKNFIRLGVINGYILVYKRLNF